MFGRSQPQLLGPAQDLTRDLVEPQLPGYQHGWCRLTRRSAEGGPEAGEELVDRKRLGEVVVGAQIEGPHLGLLIGRGGDDENRGRAPRAEFPTQVEAA